jgi:hypothetical protein
LHLCQLRQDLSQPTLSHEFPIAARLSDMSSPAPVSPLVQMNESVMGRIYGHFSGHDSSTATRLLLIIALALVAHVAVRTIRSLSEWIIIKSHAANNPFRRVVQKPKLIRSTASSSAESSLPSIFSRSG